jgi:hypothetical protein
LLKHSIGRSRIQATTTRYIAGAIPSELPAKQGIDPNLSNKMPHSNNNQSKTADSLTIANQLISFPDNVNRQGL